MRKFAVLMVFVLTALLVVPVVAQDTGGITEGMLLVAPELFDRAITAFEAQDYEQAVLDASMVILLNPTYSRAYLLRALSYLSLEQPDNALADLEIAIEHAPSVEFESALRLTRADIYIQQENWDLALDELDSAIEISPETPDAYVMRARVYALQERYEDALADYDQAITLAPDFLDAYLDRARLHRDMGNYEEALDDYTHLVENAPQNAPLYLERGTVYKEAGSDAEAATDFLQWIRSISTTINDDHQLVIGESIQLELEEGLVYLVPFQATQGQVVNIEATRAPDAEADPLLVLMTAEEGEPLAGDDDSGGDLNAAILNYTIPQDGVYAIVLSHSGGGAAGSVVLKLASVSS
jgi:tetratricopeptide (TPR) repeat protein